MRDASSLHIFKKNLNDLYLTMVNLFDVKIDVPGAWYVLV